jgi:hypothetical protein
MGMHMLVFDMITWHPGCQLQQLHLRIDAVFELLYCIEQKTLHKAYNKCKNC